MDPLLLLAPLLAGGSLALVLGYFQKNSASKYVALLGSALSSLLILYTLLYQGAQPQFTLNWFSFSTFAFPLYFSLSSINAVLLVLVAIISPLIFWYSIGYMDLPSEQGRYYFELSLFAASMLLFAMAADFITVFIAWEGLGITSYLLIGFWYHRADPPFAARKAITTIIIGDILMLSGMLVIWTYYHTFSFAAISSALSSSHSVPSALTYGLVLVLFAAFTKSAQFPFHEWLSDAMEGPTPVSAFLHSSTMVKAGVFLIALLLPLYSAAGLLNIMLIGGIITVFLGALNALSSRHLKKILAYSTIEDLGIMFVALGLGALYAAMLLFIVQTFYKALLFMSAGTIMKANDDNVDIYGVRSFGKSRLLFSTALLGALSLAGVFPLSGFFGKAAVDTAASANMAVYIALTLLDFLTALYIFRWLFLPVRQQKEEPDPETAIGYRSLGWSMVAPQVVLSIFVAGITAMIVVAPKLLAGYPITPTILDSAIESAAVAAGIAAAYALFYRRAGAFSERSGLREFLSKGLFVNLAYSYIARFVWLAARAVEAFDYELNRVFYSGGRGMLGLGNTIRQAENGSVNAYIAAFALGLALILIILVVGL